MEKTAMGDDRRGRVLGWPQGHEIGVVVAVDDEIIAWLEQHYRPTGVTVFVTEDGDRPGESPY
jgi:hypothetical protein